MAMKLKFKANPKKFSGGECYVTGKFYYLGKEETCLWIKRGVVDEASMEPVQMTQHMLDEHEANLQKGQRFTLIEVFQSLHAEFP